MRELAQAPAASPGSEWLIHCRRNAKFLDRNDIVESFAQLGRIVAWVRLNDHVVFDEIFVGIEPVVQINDLETVNLQVAASPARALRSPACSDEPGHAS
jgi:hypothetical protein